MFSLLYAKSLMRTSSVRIKRGAFAPPYVSRIAIRLGTSLVLRHPIPYSRMEQERPLCVHRLRSTHCPGMHCGHVVAGYTVRFEYVPQAVVCDRRRGNGIENPS